MLPTDAPPDDGRIQLHIPVAPVSFQATASRKAALVSTVRSLVSPCRYLLTDDVTVQIRLHISARARYESNGSSDVDNIVKPILDALCGPDGILVDDCQVQALTCYWTGGLLDPKDESVDVDLTFDPDAYLPKSVLQFLHIENALYFPIPAGDPTSTAYARRVIGRFADYRQLLEEGLNERAARSVLPLQRVFHNRRWTAFV